MTLGQQETDSCDSKTDERVVIENPETMNLLGLLMKGMLEINLSDERLYKRACGLQGDIRVQAGEMAVTLRFDGQGLRILREADQRPRASVSGSMSALLGVVVRERLVRSVLTGAVRIWGNPFMLLKVLPLIRAPRMEMEA